MKWQRRSIYKEFAQKLVFATSLFVVILSLMFYGFTKATIYEEVSDEMFRDAKLIRAVFENSEYNSDNLRLLSNESNAIEVIDERLEKINLRKFQKDNSHYMELTFPLNKEYSKYVKITRNINPSHKTLNKIFGNLFFLSIGGLIMIILYALTMSKTLLHPIIRITRKLSNMNENSLTQIDINRLPMEFEPLANSINTLTTRIESYVKYQKELFIGAAHELKTPLAVMKLKSQVTLARPREIQKYQEVLKLHLNEIDGMNNMISSILDMGRQEGAQFERPVEVDIVNFIESKVESFKLLAKEKNIELSFIKNIESFKTIMQPTLLTQIIQNFCQNAIKFTPKDKSIVVQAQQLNNTLIIEVIDEGIGIDESVDLFAPFKRVGNEKGAGLGLFLAKSAADTLGGSISLHNRTDGVSGTVATLTLHLNPSCLI
ncbi:MAG: HAMP domain-containing histidine kinase [Campylobacterales bacterium]|nr:HAMP domain-containing histidine kinase [Campylobacterales bacterium]